MNAYSVPNPAIHFRCSSDAAIGLAELNFPSDIGYATHCKVGSEISKLPFDGELIPKVAVVLDTPTQGRLSAYTRVVINRQTLFWRNDNM